MLEGEVVLVNAGREHVLRAGDCACFPAGEPIGHYLQNLRRSGLAAGIPQTVANE